MKRGFTLVEILIVVVILGILAAIVIPQFTEASSEAKVSSLVSNLQTVRSQIELYKIQHNDKLPTELGIDFVDALTQKSDQDGTLNATGKYGPYLQKMPANPFIDDANNAVAVKIGAATDTPGTGTEGWFFNTTLGFKANDAGSTTDGTTHTS
ncbi:MAG: hypothetical protein A2178_04110, partial [Planctomycetes bacterium GWC2_49_10]